jgi:hypothetical protein
MSGLNISGQTGDTLAADSTNPLPKQGRFGEFVVSQLRGRWYEHNIRGRLFSGSMALTSISAATFSAATLGPTATPIAGIWNPQNSGVNAEVELAQLSVVITALQQTGPGGFGWYYSSGNNTKISTGAPGVSRYTGNASAKCQNMAGQALTGLSNNLAFFTASALIGGSASNLATLQTAAGLQPTQSGVSEEHLDGSIIITPGCVLALLCGTTPVAHSAWAGLVWAEVPTT